MHEERNPHYYRTCTQQERREEGAKYDSTRPKRLYLSAHGQTVAINTLLLNRRSKFRNQPRPSREASV